MAHCSRVAMKFSAAIIGGLGLMLLGSSPAWAVKVATLTVNSQGEKTQVVIDFDGPFTDPMLFSLDGPPRLIVDVPNLVAKSGTVQPGNGALKSFRFGQPSPGTGRIVLDLAGPAQVSETRTFDPDGADGHYRLVLDIRPTSQEGFSTATRSGKRKLPGSLGAASKPPAKPEASPPPKADPPPPKAAPELAPPPPPPQAINVPEVKPLVAEKIRGRLPIVW
jgi:hypothetical protein